MTVVKQESRGRSIRWVAGGRREEHRGSNGKQTVRNVPHQPLQAGIAWVRAYVVGNRFRWQHAVALAIDGADELGALLEPRACPVGGGGLASDGEKQQDDALQARRSVASDGEHDGAPAAAPAAAARSS